MELKRLLKQGMSGADVRLAKDRLFALGFYSTNIKAITNSTLGSDSVAAVKRFQIKNGLQVDGIIGKITWAALFGEQTEQPPEQSTILDTILNLCEQEVKNGSIYVWATSGELGINVTESWIRTKENRNNGGANFSRALAMWQKRINEGNKVFRVFDCSGFVSWVLTRVGVFSGRRDCDGLWALSTRLSAPINGALLFRVNKDNSEDETHVGLYFNGYAYHAKGRDVGVVKELYDASYWKKCAQFKALVGK